MTATGKDLEHLGKALAYLRTRANLSARELARRSSITRAMVSGYEKGRNQPAIRTLGLILDALGADLVDLDRALAEVQNEGDSLTAGFDARGSISLLGIPLDSEESQAALEKMLKTVEQFCETARRELKRGKAREES